MPCKTRLTTFLLCLMVAVLPVATFAQQFINGDFENNTAVTDQINLNNVNFNNFMANVNSFGTTPNPDIITSATYGSPPQNGNWYVAITGGGTDILAIQLNTPLVAGNSYTMNFYDHSWPNFVSNPIEIGASTTNNNFGTLIHTTAAGATNNTWTLRTFTFTAPNNATNIVVRQQGIISNWVQIDNFWLDSCQGNPISLGNDTSTCTGNPFTLDAGAGYASYSWSTNDTTQTIVASQTGTYIASATDTNGCTVTDTIHIDIGQTPTLSMSTTNAPCTGTPTGSATVTATGIGPYSYSWTGGGGNQPTATGLAPGSYTVTVSDTIGCSATANATISVPAAFQLTLTPNDETCTGWSNGSISSFVSGGIAPFTYIWSNGATTPNVSGLTAGNYSVTVIDSAGCQMQASATVGTKPGPSVTTYGNPSFCEGEKGDTLFTTVSGGNAPYYYTWWCDTNTTWCGLDSVFDDDPIAQPGQSNWFYVQVVDNNGCSSPIDSIYVVVKPKPIVNAGPDKYICQSPAPCTILQPSISGAPGPFVYSWYPSTGLNDSTILNPCARPDTTTLYTLTAFSLANGCSSKKTTVDTISTVTVHVQPLPIATANVPGPDVDLCEGDCVTLQGYGSGAGPNYNYQWSPTSGLSSPNIANPVVCPALYTEYILTVWSNGCPSYGDTVRIHVHANPTADAGPDVEICPGDTAQLLGQGSGDPTSNGYKFAWTPTNVIVGGDSLENPKATADTTTKIYVTAISSWGCSSPIDSTTLHVKPAPQAEAGPNLVLCTGHELQLQGGYYYLNGDTSADPGKVFYTWSPDDSLSDPNKSRPFATPDITTFYYLTLEYENCESWDSMLVTVVPEVIAIADADTLVICEDDSLQLFASGGIGNPNYQWLPAAGIQNAAAQTTGASPPSSVDLMLVVEEGGCRDTAMLPITVIPLPDINIVGSNLQGCVPHTVSLMESGANTVSYTWGFGDGSAIENEQMVTHTYTQPGSYNVTLLASNMGRCEVTDSSVIVKVHDTAVADFTTSEPLPAEFNIGNAFMAFEDQSIRAVSWHWDFGDQKGYSAHQSPDYAYSTAGTFYPTLTITNSFGCISSTTKGPIIVKAPEVMIPNIFTPNGDGVSDYYLVDYSGDQPFGMSILDRWGVQHFNTDNKMEGWDGSTASGEAANPGVYFYIVRIGPKEYAGEFTLIR